MLGIPRLLTVTPLVKNTPYLAILRQQMLCIFYSVNVLNSVLARQLEQPFHYRMNGYRSKTVSLTITIVDNNTV